MVSVAAMVNVIVSTSVAWNATLAGLTPVAVPTVTVNAAAAGAEPLRSRPSSNTMDTLVPSSETAAEDTVGAVVSASDASALQGPSPMLLDARTRTLYCSEALTESWSSGGVAPTSLLWLAATACAQVCMSVRHCTV